MASDHLGKIGLEGFGLVDNFYGACKCNRRRMGAQERNNCHMNNVQRNKEEPITVNDREAAMKYHGVSIFEGYHYKPAKPEPKNRWGKMFLLPFKH